MDSREKPKLKVTSWVRRGGELVSTDSLTPEERRDLSDWVNVTMLNEAYAGRYRFSAAGRTGSAARA